MWLYLIWNLVKTSQRNYFSGAIHSAGYEFRRAAALHRSASVEKFSTIDATQFPITCPWQLDLQLYFWSKGLRSDKPSYKHDSNKYQTKAFVICDHKSDQTRTATLVNKTYLFWLMYWLLFNQHCQHRTNQKLRSWANAVFQNRGVCG